MYCKFFRGFLSPFLIFLIVSPPMITIWFYSISFLFSLFNLALFCGVFYFRLLRVSFLLCIQTLIIPPFAFLYLDDSESTLKRSVRFSKFSFFICISHILEQSGFPIIISTVFCFMTLCYEDSKH